MGEVDAARISSLLDTRSQVAARHLFNYSVINSKCDTNNLRKDR